MIDKKKYEQLREDYILAIRGNVEDKYRIGDLIELPKHGDIVIMGDLHGNRSNFRKVVAATGLDTHPHRHLIIQEPTHTYEVSRDLSFLLIDEIVQLKRRFPHQVHTILGNHELSEYTGRELLKGGICYNILFREGMKQEYGEYFQEIRDLMYNFMKTMPLACITPSRIFISHSTPEMKYIPLYTMDFFRQGTTGDTKKDKFLIEKLVWSRDLSAVSADAFAKQIDCDIFIVGHTACKRGYQIPNHRHIILDSKGTFAVSLHFKLDRSYTHEDLKQKIQYINRKNVKEILEKIKMKNSQTPANSDVAN